MSDETAKTQPQAQSHTTSDTEEQQAQPMKNDKAPNHEAPASTEPNGGTKLGAHDTAHTSAMPNTTNDDTPEDDVPDDAAPKSSASEDETSEDETPEDETSEDETSEDETSEDEISDDDALSPPQTNLATAPHTNAAPPGTKVPDDVAQGLEVEIRFEIGRVILPLEALANLQPDQILQELNGFVFPKVKALSAGRVFAEGELVQLDERIGFRITKIYS